MEADLEDAHARVLLDVHTRAEHWENRLNQSEDKMREWLKSSESQIRRWIDENHSSSQSEDKMREGLKSAESQIRRWIDENHSSWNKAREVLHAQKATGLVLGVLSDDLDHNNG